MAENEEEISISVVMPVYNRELYLAEAIESILNQTFSNFEFIIINDGSTDKTEEIILEYQKKDKRIKYFQNKENIGNNRTRNKGTKLAKGKYIAIMDSDDISVPDRLETQFNYLEKYPDVGILGGFKIFFDEEGKWFQQHYPTDENYLKAFLFFKNAFGQPTVMLRREFIIKHELFYIPELENMGDYNLWYRASLINIKIKSLPKVLLYYRLSPSQIGSRKLDDRKQKLKRFFAVRLAMLDMELQDDDFNKLHHFIRGKVKVSAADYKTLKFLLNDIDKRNIKIGLYDLTAFKAALFYFRLRLIKYYYLENKKDKTAFAAAFVKLCFKTGTKALQIFWQNEGKYFNIKNKKRDNFTAQKKWLQSNI